MDYAKLTEIFVQATSFIAAFAAITAAVIMARFIRKFVTGILAVGFRTIGIGIFILAIAIIIDVTENYTQALVGPLISSMLLIVRQIFFVVGTYTIVIGTKNMGDKLKMLSGGKSA